jgi:hypothetical protein
MPTHESSLTEDHLSSAEQHELERCEQSIDHLRQAFIDAGSALATIRDQRLYRVQYATFEDYCQQRWGFSRVRAHQLIDAARTSITLLTIVNTTLPENEAQVRPLSQLETPEEQHDVWQEAVERSNGSPTGRIVQEVVHERTRPPHTCYRCGEPARVQNRIDGEWVWLCARHQEERLMDEQEGRVDRFGYSDEPVQPPAFQRGDLVIWTRADGSEHVCRVVHNIFRGDLIEIEQPDGQDITGTRTVPAERLRLVHDSPQPDAPQECAAQEPDTNLQRMLAAGLPYDLAELLERERWKFDGTAPGTGYFRFSRHTDERGIEQYDACIADLRLVFAPLLPAASGDTAPLLAQSDLPGAMQGVQRQLEAHGWQVTRPSAQVWHISRQFVGEDAVTQLQSLASLLERGQQ